MKSAHSSHCGRGVPARSSSLQRSFVSNNSSSIDAFASERTVLVPNLSRTPIKIIVGVALMTNIHCIYILVVAARGLHSNSFSVNFGIRLRLIRFAVKCDIVKVNRILYVSI